MLLLALLVGAVVITLVFTLVLSLDFPRHRFVLGNRVAVLLLSALIILESALHEAGLHMEGAWRLVFLLAPVALAPLSWLFFVHFFEPKKSFRPGDRHFTGLLIMAALFLLTQFWSSPPLHTRLFYYAGILYIGIYLYASGGYLWKRQRDKIFHNPHFKTLGFIWLGYCFIWVVNLAGYFATEKLIHGAHAGFGLVILLQFLAGHRYPQLYMFTGREETDRPGKERAAAPGSASPTPRYEKSALGKIDPEKLGRAITKLMEQDQLFRDDTLSLNKFAHSLGYTPHQVSEYLNRIMGVNFYQLVQSYRVRYAAGRLLQDPREKILVIAFDAGFPSKSSFNASFRREMGTTPREFRKKKSG